jgi:hypothetical protein
MAINISALNAFRGAAQWNNDAVANLSGDGISSPGLYEGKFKAAFTKRSQTVKDANNAVRTALLKALGNAYGLAYGEGDPMGTITHETKFEFDLSNKDEAKLTSVNFKQTV